MKVPFKVERAGTWTIRCPSDSRFDGSGRADGMWDANSLMDQLIRAKAKELGIEEQDIPEDIEVSFWKD